MKTLCNVLVVEDRDEDVLLLLRTLRKSPRLHVVGHVRDGDEAIMYLASAFEDSASHPLPDLVILDLGLPNRDGMEVLRWLHGKFPRPKVGVWTISDDPVHMERVHALGADLVQRKTLDEEALTRFLHWMENIACLAPRAEDPPSTGEQVA